MGHHARRGTHHAVRMGGHHATNRRRWRRGAGGLRPARGEPVVHASTRWRPIHRRCRPGDGPRLRTRPASRTRNAGHRPWMVATVARRRQSGRPTARTGRIDRGAAFADGAGARSTTRMARSDRRPSRRLQPRHRPKHAGVGGRRHTRAGARHDDRRSPPGPVSPRVRLPRRRHEPRAGDQWIQRGGSRGRRGGHVARCTCRTSAELRGGDRRGRCLPGGGRAGHQRVASRLRRRIDRCGGDAWWSWSRPGDDRGGGRGGHVPRRGRRHGRWIPAELRGGGRSSGALAAHRRPVAVARGPSDPCDMGHAAWATRTSRSAPCCHGHLGDRRRRVGHGVGREHADRHRARRYRERMGRAAQRGHDARRRTHHDRRRRRGSDRRCGSPARPGARASRCGMRSHAGCDRGGVARPAGRRLVDRSTVAMVDDRRPCLGRGVDRRRGSPHAHGGHGRHPGARRRPVVWACSPVRGNRTEGLHRGDHLRGGHRQLPPGPYGQGLGARGCRSPHRRHGGCAHGGAIARRAGGAPP